MGPLAADRIRKVTAGLLAVATTFLLFRVLARLAGGSQSAGDPELWTLLALVAAGMLWVRAARRPPTSGPSGP